MDVRLSPEQQALRDSAAKVAADLGPHAVGELDDAERKAKLDAAVEAAGWRELRGEGDDGEPLASAVEAAIVAEELGRGLADTAFVGPAIAADLRRRAGAPAAADRETVALSSGLETVATADDEGVVEALAFDTAGASTALVLVGGQGGHTLAQVELPGSRTQTDQTRGTAAVGPADTFVLAGQRRRLDTGDLAAVTALGLALTCADLVGTMRGAVELSTEYAKDRRQYGTPIGAFQAVQHLLADAFVLMEGSRSVALHAAWAVDALEPAEAVAAAAAAKAYAARAARTVCETAIQVHGGIGNTWECLAHVYLRRALLATDAFGGVGTNLDRVLTHRGIGADRGLR